MAKDTTLQGLFTDELRDAYHAEKQLVKALPKMVKAATSADLKQALQAHLGETEEHVSRIEEAFSLLDEPVRAKACAGMQGIIEEGADVISEEDRGVALDAAIIASGQRAEHYEMAAYGTLIAWATALGHDDVAELLQRTLDEEKAADSTLTRLAEGGINTAAAGDGDEAHEDVDQSTVSASSAGRTKATTTDRRAGDRISAMKAAARRR